MKRLKHNFKKGMAFVLSLAMVAGLVPAMSGGANKVQAASGSGMEPSVSAYATKTQLMDGTFAPNADGTAVNYGKIVFGKNSSGDAQKWYILGKDEGVSGDNTIIFAASPIATNQLFENNPSDNKAFQSSFGVYESNPSEVHPNHYGASDLRVVLQGMAKNTSYFTTAEQGLMNDTTVTTEDTNDTNDTNDSSVTYTTTDKLYALQGDYNNNKYLWAGSSDSTVLAKSSYWSSGDAFWLRSPDDNFFYYALIADPSYYNCAIGDYVDAPRAVQPASNLNLSSVLFASSAKAADSAADTAEKISTSSTAMTLRLDGSGKGIGTASYNTKTGDIKVAKGSTSQTVALVVQGNDGTNDWYYSKQITGTETVNVTAIEAETNTPASIDLSTCKIWLEITDSTENLIYAVNAEKEIEKINTTYVTKEQLMNSFKPCSDGTAANYGKLVFGKKSDGTTAQEWYILGKDEGVSGDNTIIFAASPIATGKQFNSSTSNKTFDSSFGVYASNPSEVFANHYGASDLRVVLKGMTDSSNTTYFTTAEQGLMNATTVTTTDTKNKDSSNNYLTYTTTDKLYALAADGYGYKTIKAGTNNQTVLAMSKYWSSGTWFWLRSPDDDHASLALLAFPGNCVGSPGVNSGRAVQPASNLNLSSVLFASAATAALSDTVSNTITSETAMTLRFDGTGRNIGTVTYNTTTGDIKAAKGSTSQTVALVVQGKGTVNGEEKDWYYSKKIDTSETINVSAIKAESNTPASIDLSTCKIWLEMTDTDGLIYAVNADKEIESINTTYVTKEQLMNAFKPCSDGTAANYGKLVFGKNSSGNPQEWYILGKDEGVSGDNTIIFAANPIATGQMFEDDWENNKTEQNLWSDCNYNGTSITVVYPNHYGASDLRVALKNMATNPSYFTSAEQGLMNATTVTTKDTNNSSVTYTITDKLYALAADGYGSSYTTIKAGSGDSTVLAMNSYWSSGDWFWLRSPDVDYDTKALLADPGDYVDFYYVDRGCAVQPASNLNLSSVLFASAAMATSSNPAELGTIALDKAMTLRLAGTGKDIGTVTYNTTTGDIKVAKGSTSQPVALVVQGNDGTNDWYYSKQITGTETVNVSAIETETNTPTSIDLSACKIWLEMTDTDGLIYAVNADKEIEKINTTYVTKEQLMNAFKPCSDGTSANYGKLVFGKKSDGTTAQEWYILGKDTGVSGDNTIIFAASPIATNKAFNSSAGNKDNSALWSDCNYGGASVTAVYANHYGASDLRDTLQTMAANPSYFTTAEQGLMNATTVTTKDTKNKDDSDNYLTYTTTDKLYALAADGSGSSYTTIKAGSDNSTVLAMNSYWRSGGGFWLRSPDGTNVSIALVAYPGSYVYDGNVYFVFAVQPASNLNLSSVLFASAATAASSDTAESYTIASGTAMTLRFDGTGKNIGTVTYNTTTGDIKVAKGSTSQPVALVVQGNAETNDWYYSKRIAGPETVNASDIRSALSLTSDIDLSACKIWLEITDSTENLTYAVNATENVDSDISSVVITGIDTPTANTTLDTSAACATTGVSSTTPQITWTPSDTTAGYNTSYTASITLTADTGYEFADTVTATVSGNNATSTTKNADGTLTVTYAFPATAKDKLTSITAPQAITVANGTAYSAMNLPATVNIVTEGNTVSSAPVTWNTTTPANGSYDPAVLIEQTVTLNGTVACPDSIDANGVSLTTTITITISAADIVGAPTANPTAGTYSENQSVALTSSTEGATIYYTTDGSEPTISGGVTGGTTQQYTAPILVTGTEGQSITTTIKAIAVKNGMQDSSVETFTYTIQIKDKLISITAPQAITVANGTAYDAMNLPATVSIVTKGNTVSSAPVTWNTTTPASGSYDPAVLTQQTVTLNGTVACPDSIDANGVSLTTTITITISAAGIVGAPTANPTAGTYSENQSVALTSSTEGATIYYTTDGSEPTITGGTTKQYTAPILVTGTEGQSIITTIKAIAVKNGMQDSSVETFTYTIQIPVAKYTVTVTNGSGTGQYAQGETVTITAGAAPSGQQFKEWEVVSGTITLASSTSETTTFTMPAEAVSVKANYEAIPVTGYTITATAGANGSISPSGNVTVTEGGSQTFTISASSGYEIDTLTVDNVAVTVSESYTFSDVRANHTIEVTFKQTIQNPVAPGIITQPGNATVKEGETATFSVAASGENLTYQWMINRNDGNGWVNIGNANEASYTTSVVDKSCGGFQYKCVVSNSGGTVESGVAILNVQLEEPTYKMLEGMNGKWAQNSKGTLSFRADGDFNKFVGVKVDNSLLETQNYSAKSGSTIVTLKGDYLKTLSVGSHRLTVVYDDGECVTSFVIQKASNNNSGSPSQGGGNDVSTGNQTQSNGNDASTSNQTQSNSNDASTSNQALGNSDNVSTEKNVSASGKGKKDDVPKTGGSTPIVWLYVLVGISGAGLILTGKKCEKNRKTLRK